MTDKETAYKKIETLINRFAEQEEFYKKSTYNETETRRDFIDPFFDALGWDIDNKKGLLQTERDVNHEARVKISGHSKAADYSFKSRGKLLFFVEAKKPAILLKETPEPAIQVRTYGWNAKLNISILTDFEEFVIYDCTKKVSKLDKASKNRIKFIHYKDYLKEFDFLYDTFSKDAVEKGSLEHFAQKNINDREKETVDKEFLKSLENWRTYLAINIAANNKVLDEDEINFCVQQTIDRIVFLKICEDREIETEGNLKKCLKKGNYYKNLFEYFNSADQKYNSGIFDFKKDTITSKLKIDNKIIENIINDFDEIGFDFSKIPIEILGYAYEQFLGKVIRLEKSGHAVIETKPEIRKAGGVFYTPEYIVAYIVTNTVGKLIEYKTPEEISKIKILDPACGSGSFLLGAYQFLLNYHQNYYIKNLKGKITKNSPINQEGYLTTAEKKRILINNIFGVDIDLQAVEVTKLSLLIKAMEGETTTSIETSLQLFHQRVLPSLDKNILSGNSLISPDFEGLGLTPKEERKINVFDWKAEFKEIFKQGGFDVVIGNPPYVSNKEIPIIQKKYFERIYTNAQNQYDLYTLFIEKGINLLKANGLFSLIVPDAIFDRSNALKSRKYILDTTKINTFLQINNVFEQASVGSAIINLTKTKIKNNLIDFYKYANHSSYVMNLYEYKQLSQENILKVKNYSFLFADDLELNILNKILQGKILLGDVTFMGRGEEMGKSSDLVIAKKIKKSRQIIFGEDVHRYSIKYENRYILEKNIKKDDKLYKNKIVVRQVGKEINATLDNQCAITIQSIYTIIPNENYNLHYILGILNSKLINFVYQKLFKSKEIFPRILLEGLRELPIKQIDKTTKSEKQLYDKITDNVEKIMSFYNELLTLKMQSQKDNILRKIDYAESEINNAVYQLYNILPEEIEIIEKNG